jgi:hypothetical protein
VSSSAADVGARSCRTQGADRKSAMGSTVSSPGHLLFGTQVQAGRSDKAQLFRFSNRKVTRGVAAISRRIPLRLHIWFEKSRAGKRLVPGNGGAIANWTSRKWNTHDQDSARGRSASVIIMVDDTCFAAEMTIMIPFAMRLFSSEIWGVENMLQTIASASISTS